MALSFSEKYGYGFGAVGKDMVYAVVAGFYLKFATDTLGVNPAFMGILFFVARIWDAFNDPLMGAVVDHTKSRWGKFRPWILIGTAVNALVLVFLFYSPGLEASGLLVWVSVTYILWGMTYTIMDIPYWSIIPSLTEDEGERNLVSTIPRIFAALGNLLTNVFSLSMIERLGRGDDARGYLAWATAIAGIFLLSSLVTVIFAREKIVVPLKAPFSFKELFRTLFANDQLLVIVGSMVLFQATINLTTSLGLYYFQYDLGNIHLYSTFALVAGAGQVAAMLLFPTAARLIGRRRIFYLSVFLPIIGYSLMLVLGLRFGAAILPLGIAGFILFMGLGSSNVLTTVMLADAVDYGEHKLGYRSESVVFSMQTFLVKFATALSGLISGVGLFAIGYRKNEVQSAATIGGLRLLMFGLPPLLLLAALFIYRRRFRLDGETMAAIREDLHRRRAAS